MGIRTIPHILTQRAQWLVWRHETRNGCKPTKVPYQVNGRYAKSNDPTTWCDFETAVKAMETGQFDGIGFAFTPGDGLAAIDLDHCFENGKLEPWAQEIVTKFPDAYVEYSPSGDGLHIWWSGRPGATGSKKWPKHDTNLMQGIEVYDYRSPRYLTVTGNRYGVSGLFGRLSMAV